MASAASQPLHSPSAASGGGDAWTDNDLDLSDAASSAGNATRLVSAVSPSAAGVASAAAVSDGGGGGAWADDDDDLDLSDDDTGRDGCGRNDKGRGGGGAGGGAGAPGGAPPLTADGSAVDFRAVLVEFYTARDLTSKLVSIDQILEQYRGEEHEMLRTLYRKYDAPLPAWLDDGRPKPPSGGGGGGLFATKALGWLGRAAGVAATATPPKPPAAADNDVADEFGGRRR
jgi:hypothetical protein